MTTKSMGLLPIRDIERRAMAQHRFCICTIGRPGSVMCDELYINAGQKRRSKFVYELFDDRSADGFELIQQSTSNGLHYFTLRKD